MIDIIQHALHYIVPFIVVISIVVFVHEFGHYWVARRCGVRILTFSIGFGSEIFGWNDRHGTRWKVCWLPLGGYVKMFGDADPASRPDEAVHTMTDDERKVAFFHQSIGKRMAIVVAGPAVNYIFAILVLAFLFTLKGQPYSPPDISEVSANGAAAIAGLMPGDHVTAIDGSTINRFEDIKRTVAINEGTPLVFDIERAGKPMHFTITPEIVTTTDHFGDEEKTGRIGIASSKIEYEQRAPVEALGQAIIESYNLTVMSLKAVGQIIVGSRGADELGGPLRIAEMSGKVAKDGAIALVWFLAMISINLGFINLFPVPILDGGHLAFYCAEWLRGKPLSQDVQEVGGRVGVLLVLSLMVFATWNDLVHLKVVSYIRNLFS